MGLPSLCAQLICCAGARNGSPSPLTGNCISGSRPVPMRKGAAFPISSPTCSRLLRRWTERIIPLQRIPDQLADRHRAMRCSFPQVFLLGWCQLETADLAAFNHQPPPYPTHPLTLPTDRQTTAVGPRYRDQAFRSRDLPPAASGIVLCAPRSAACSQPWGGWSAPIAAPGHRGQSTAAMGPHSATGAGMP